MALQVFTPGTPIHPYEYSDERPIVLVRFAGGGNEQRAATLSRKLRRYVLRFRCRTSARETIDAFFLSRGYQVESFLWKDLKDYARTGITPTPGTGDGATTVFTLPLTGEYGGDYPIDNAAAVLKVDGVPVTKTVQTDARTMTAAVAPGVGTAITMDYEYYRRVRLARPYTWREPVFGTFETEIEIGEVPA